MRDRAEGLHEQQALLRRGQIDAASDHLLGQAKVVARGVVAEQRQMEAVLAERGAVAAPAIASGAEEDRHHVQAEADGTLGGRLGYGIHLSGGCELDCQ